MAITFAPLPGGYGHLARNPDARGVIEFLPGAFWGILPHFTYQALLESLYNAGFTIVAVPIRLSLDHQAIADQLVAGRVGIHAALGTQADLPRFWVAHSLGCKFVALLEAAGQIPGEPSVLLAPVIADTEASLPPIPVVAHLLAEALDGAGLGVRPTAATQTAPWQPVRALRSDRLRQRRVAQTTVAWLLATLQSQPGIDLKVAHLAGAHDEPVGFTVGDQVVHIDPTDGLLEHNPLPVATQIIAWLEQWLP